MKQPEDHSVVEVEPSVAEALVELAVRRRLIAHDSRRQVELGHYMDVTESPSALGLMQRLKAVESEEDQLRGRFPSCRYGSRTRPIDFWWNDTTATYEIRCDHEPQHCYELRALGLANVPCTS